VTLLAKLQEYALLNHLETPKNVLSYQITNNPEKTYKNDLTVSEGTSL
jgi:hypothetical protein